MFKPIKQAELARRWNVSRERIRQYKNEAEPMPLDSEEAALAWLSIHYPERAVEIIEAQTDRSELPSGVAPPPGCGDFSGDGVEVVLLRARQVELSAWEALEDEMKRPDDKKNQAVIESRTKHYLNCADARQVLEERFLEYQLKSKQSVMTSEVVHLLGKVLVPIQTAMNSFPYSAGPLVNPTDPEFAAKVLGDEMEKMRSQLIDGLRRMEGELHG